MVRRVLRAKYCLRILLNPINELRPSLFQEVGMFCWKKGDYRFKIDEKKKQEGDAKKKDAEEKKKKAVEQKKGKVKK